jgi:maltose O-acetyltransferase
MVKQFPIRLFFIVKRVFYTLFSNNTNVLGTCKSIQPLVKRGSGKIIFGKNVKFGIINSPLLYSNYSYIEARSEESTIIFGNNVHINNAFSAISEKEIKIKDNVLIGYNCCIYDSNFHDLDANNRNNSDPSPKAVIINNNVFIGNNVTILKGVEIGENSIIGSGSVVTKSFPNNVVIGGNPAKVIKILN